MFGPIDHTAEIATCAYFFGFQRTDRVTRIIFHLLKNDASLPQDITKTFQTYGRQKQSVCPACCALLSLRARLPWHAQKMCAVTINSGHLSYIRQLIQTSDMMVPNLTPFVENI